MGSWGACVGLPAPRTDHRRTAAGAPRRRPGPESQAVYARAAPASATSTTPATATAATTCATTTSTSPTTRPPTSSDGDGPRSRARPTQPLLQLQPRLRRPGRPQGHRQRPRGGWRRDGPGADRRRPRAHARSGDASRCAVTLPRRAAGVPPAGSRPAHRLHDHPRRRDRGRSARGRGRLVPGQRPPARQGLLHLRRDGAGRLRGRRQRLPARPAAAHKTTWHWSAPEPMASYLATIDIGTGTSPHGTRDGLPATTRSTPTSPASLRSEIDSSLARQGEIVGLLEQQLRALPVQHRRGDRPQPGRPAVRARDPDPAGLLEAVLARPQGNPVNGD